MDRKNPRSDENSFLESSRRDFLKSATTVAAGLAVPMALEAEPAAELPTVSLGPHR
ncbi:MAG: twin-arginine translocation signal domain-containing protein, partial [Terriglobia bacterium]